MPDHDELQDDLKQAVDDGKATPKDFKDKGNDAFKGGKDDKSGEKRT
jgi:hypothetical protein